MGKVVYKIQCGGSATPIVISSVAQGLNMTKIRIRIQSSGREGWIDL